PHAGRDRARPLIGLHRQCRSMATAREPDADAAGDAGLPALHHAADRTRQSGRAGVSRRAFGANAPRTKWYHQDPRALVHLSKRRTRNPRNADLSPGVPASQPVAEAVRLARLPRHKKGAERLNVTDGGLTLRVLIDSPYAFGSAPCCALGFAAGAACRSARACGWRQSSTTEA